MKPKLEASQPKRISGPTSEIYEAFKAIQPAVTSGAEQVAIAVVAHYEGVSADALPLENVKLAKEAAAIIQQAMDGASAEALNAARLECLKVRDTTEVPSKQAACEICAEMIYKLGGDTQPASGGENNG